MMHSYLIEDTWESPGKRIQITDLEFDSNEKFNSIKRVYYVLRIDTETDTESDTLELKVTPNTVDEMTRGMIQTRVGGHSVCIDTIYRLLDEVDRWKNMANCCCNNGLNDLSW